MSNYVFRLSRIGNALPVDHIYPTGNDEHDYRPGAQCFRAIEDVVVELKMGSMCTGADRLLLIQLVCDSSELPHDESGWVLIDRNDVVAVRSLPVSDPDALMTDYDDDEAMWSAATTVDVSWVRTIDTAEK